MEQNFYIERAKRQLANGEYSRVASMVASWIIGRPFGTEYVETNPQKIEFLKWWETKKRV